MHGTVYNSTAIEFIAGLMKKEYKLDFHTNEVKQQIQSIEKRFYIFHQLINYPGVVWQKRTNVIIAPDDIWERLIKMDPLTEAYTYGDDPLYQQLKNIFYIPELFNLVDESSDEDSGTSVVSPIFRDGTDDENGDTSPRTPTKKLRKDKNIQHSPDTCGSSKASCSPSGWRKLFRK